MRNLALLGLLAMLVAFGCAGKSYQAPSGAPSGSGQPPAIAVGDSDIAPQPSQSESDTLSSEDVVPADNASASVTAGNGTALPEDSDLLVSNSTNEDLISQEDVVGPP